MTKTKLGMRGEGKGRGGGGNLKRERVKCVCACVRVFISTPTMLELAWKAGAGHVVTSIESAGNILSIGKGINML